MKLVLPKFLALWMVLMLAAARADTGRSIIETYQPAAIGGGRSWSLAQDEQGTFYFGCDALVTFDGERWSKYPVPGSYTVRGIAIGPDRVWVGAVNEIGYFERGSGSLSAYHSLLPYLPANQRNIGDIWEVFRQDGEVIFAGSSAVYVWTGTELRVLSKPGARRLAGFAAGGRLLFLHRPTGLWVLEHDRLEPFLSADQLGQAHVMWIGYVGQTWQLVTDQGLLRYDGRTLTRPDIAANAFIRANLVFAGCVAPNGDIVLGTESGGVAVIGPDGRIKRNLGTADGLPSQLVPALMVGQDGALWTAAPAGVARVPLDEAVSLFDERLGLAAKDVTKIQQRGAEVLATTDDGVYAMPLTSGRTAFRLLPDLPGSYDGLCELPGGTVLVGTFQRVLALADAAQVTYLRVKSNVELIVPSARRPNTLFVGNDADVIQVEIPPGSAAPQVVGTAHLPDSPQSMAEDATGHLWLGTQTRGVSIFPEPLPPASPPASLGRPGETGVAWVGRAGRRVAVFRLGRIELYDRPEAAPQLVPDAPTTAPIAVSNGNEAGQLWAVYESPFDDEPRAPVVGRLSAPAAGPLRWTPCAVTGLARLGRITALHLDDRGVVWIGGLNGILRLDPAALPAAMALSAPRLLATVPADGRLPANQNSVQLDFAVPEYGRRPSIRYQTLFTGDANWSPPRNDPHLSVAGLRDGHYTFQVRTVTDSGALSPATSLSFTVLPPWYRTIPALAAFGAAVAAGVYGGFRWRLAYLRRQNARLEELVRKKTEQLEQANEAKSEFLANMSHEIRNPISGILGLSLAFDDTPLTARQKQLAEAINSCASLLATLVDDVLDFAKIEAGSVELRSAPFTLRVLLEQAGAMVAIEAREAGSPVRVDLDPALPEQLVGDVARLQQILLNYLTNALKFGRGRPIELGASAALHDRVRFTVRDYGPGMTPAESAKLFTKFSRLESARLHNIRGTGLGLAVCRLIADRMGGRVGVDSWPGQGSCFWAEIPLARASAGPAADRPAALPPLRALVVEDIEYNVLAMQAILRRLGLSSDVVSDGPAALRRLQETFYDVAFLDWNLPGMNGNEVASRFRAAEPPGRRTFLIATTAHSSELNREACLQAGMDAFIAKPITPDKIAEALRAVGATLRTARKVETRQEAGSADAPEIDLTMLRFLADETPEGLGGQVRRFLAAFDAERHAARAAVAAGDPQEIRRLAHRLLSHCSMVKYAPLSQLATDLQRIAAFAPTADLQRLLDQFDQEYARLRCKLELSPASTAPA